MVSTTNDTNLTLKDVHIKGTKRMKHNTGSISFKHSTESRCLSNTGEGTPLYPKKMIENLKKSLRRVEMDQNGLKIMILAQQAHVFWLMKVTEFGVRPPPSIEDFSAEEQVMELVQSVYELQKCKNCGGKVRLLAAYIPM